MLLYKKKAVILNPCFAYNSIQTVDNEYSRNQVSTDGRCNFSDGIAQHVKT